MLARLAEGKGKMGVDGGYRGLIGVFASSGSIRAFHGPWNGLPSMSSVSSEGKRQSQLGRELNLFRLMLSVCNFSRAHSDSGSVLIPVESTMRRRNAVNPARNSGSARTGFDAMFNSSRLVHAARAGGSATRKFAEISRARRVSAIWGSVPVRNDGTAFGVGDDPINRCVVPRANT